MVCALAKCCQVFFLCRDCDRGDRYCSQDCSEQARRESLRAAGRQYEKTFAGLRQNAARQARFRKRAREKVTHQGSTCGLPGAMLLVEEEATDGDEVESSKGGQTEARCCAGCGQPGIYVRLETLARCRIPRAR